MSSACASVMANDAAIVSSQSAINAAPRPKVRDESGFGG